MSPAKSRKKGASNPDSDSKTEREIALSQLDEQSEMRAADVMPDDSDTTDAADVEERIRRRAYELYCSRGQREGSELGDWFEAERQLRSGPATDGATRRTTDLFGEEPASEIRR